MILPKGIWSLIAAILIALSGIVSAEAAEKGHAHKAPHGGVIEEAEGVHAEFLIDKGGQPTLYLYDKSMRPLERSDLEPKVTIKGKGPGATEETRVLRFSKDSKEGAVFKGDRIKGLKDWDTAVVSLKLKDSPTNIRFSRHSGGHGH
jgi:hypothetical protein